MIQLDYNESFAAPASAEIRWLMTENSFDWQAFQILSQNLVT